MQLMPVKPAFCGGNGHIINGSAVRRMWRAISFPPGARIQHLISVALARISLRIALISPPFGAASRIFAAFGAKIDWNWRLGPATETHGEWRADLRAGDQALLR